MMKYIIVIIFSFFAIDIWGQGIPQMTFSEFPNAKVVTSSTTSKGEALGYKNTANYTSAVFTYNPRVEDGYYLVDIYLARAGDVDMWVEGNPVNEIWDFAETGVQLWNGGSANSHPELFYSCLGGMNMSFTLKKGLELGKHFRTIFESAEFVIDPSLLSPDESMYGSPIKVTNETFSDGSLGFGYIKNTDAPRTGIPPTKRFYMVSLRGSSPIHAGYIKMKIKDPTATASIVFLPSANSVSVYTGDTDLKNACQYHVACGWLDGKNPDISLDGKEEPTGPTPPPAPVLATIADTKLCLGKNQAEVKYDYSVTAAADTVTYYWFVSTSTDPKNPANNTKALLSTGTGSSVACTWKTAGTYLLNCYAKSKATKLHSDTVSQTITVNNRPTATITFDKQIYVDGNQIKATVAGGSSPGWILPREVANSATITETAKAETTHQFKAYVADATTGCKDTTEQSVSVGAIPKLDLVLEQECLLCTNGVGVVVIKSITNGGTPVSLDNCTVVWSKDGIDQPANADKSLTVTTAGTYKATVTNTNSTPNPVGTAEIVVNTAAYTAPQLANGVTYTIKSNTTPTVIESPITNMGTATSVTAWNWTPANCLDNAGLQRPTTTNSLPAAGQTFTVYVVDNNNCRSKDGKVRVDVSSGNGLDLQLEPAELEICKGNNAYLTALLDGKMVTNGVTYTWEPDLGSTAQVKYMSNSAVDRYIYVTAEKSGYKAMAKMHIKVKDFNAPEITRDPALMAHCLNDKIGVTESGNTYVWTNNGKADLAQTGNTYAFNSEGTYNMVVKKTDANCASDTVCWPTITIKTPPTLAPLALKSGNSVLCGDDDALVLSVTSATEPDSICWYRNGNEVTAAKNKKELAIVAADDGAVFKATAWVGLCETTTADYTVNRIAMPKLNSLLVSDTCGQVVLIADAMNASYTWAPSNLFTLSGDKKTATITLANAGNIYGAKSVKLTLANGTCKTDTSFVVNLLQKPTLAFNTEDLAKQCAGDMLTVTATPADVEYTWWKNTTKLDNKTNKYTLAQNSASEKIEVVAKAKNGCQATVSHDFRVYGKPELDWAAGMAPPSEAVIDGTEIKVGVLATGGEMLDDGYRYHFDKPYDSPFTNNTGVADYVADVDKAPANFFIWVEDKNGCKDTVTAEVGIIGVPLEIEIESAYGLQACLGGSAILTAHVTKGVGVLTYKWYNTSNPDVTLSTDSVLILQNFKAADMMNLSYAVDVECEATKGNGSKTITLNYNESMHWEAPIVTADPALVTIKSFTETVLGATAEVSDSYPANGNIIWHWTKEGLQAGEDSKQYPRTAELYENKKFQVYVVDDNGCMSNIATVDLKIDDIHGLDIKIVPESKTLCKNNSPELKVVSLANESLSGAVGQWSTSASATSKVTLASNTGLTTILQTDDESLAGTYEQVVKVTKNGYVALAKNEITVKDEMAPKLNFSDAPFCSGSTVLVSRTGQAVKKEYTWIVNGVVYANQDNKRAFTEHARYDVKVTAKGYGYECYADTISTTVFQKPVINTITPSQTVAQNTQLALQVTVTPTTGVTAAWTSAPDGYINGASTDAAKVSATTKPIQETINVTYTIKNAEEATCMDDSTIVINLKGSTFEIEAEQNNLEICAKDALAVKIIPNDLNDNITYVMTSDCPELAGRVLTSPLVKGPYTFNTTNFAPAVSLTSPGDYKLYIKGTNSKNAIGLDTVDFKVKPMPAIELDKSGTVQLCLGNGSKLPVQFEIHGGDKWDVEYSINNAAQTVTGIATTYHTIEVAAAGDFKVTKVTNEVGCVLTKDLPSFKIEDITPTVEFASTIADSVCLVDDATHELELKVNGKLDYPLTLFYRKDNGAPQQQQILLPGDKKILVANGALGVYHIDSIRNNLGCAGPATSAAADKELKQFKQGVPDIRFAENEMGLCRGTTINVPLTISGGTPAYTLAGTLGGNNVRYTVNAGSKSIAVNAPGTLVLTSVTDKNNCVDADLAGVQITIKDWETPSLALTQNQDKFTFCDGGGTAVLPVKVENGKADWKVYYRINNTAKYTETITETPWNWSVDKTGTLQVDSIVSSEGCKGLPSAALSTGVTIEDNRPYAEFANAEEEQICGGTASGSPIALTVKTAADSWPVTVWYHWVKDGVTGKKSKMITSDKVWLDIVETGSYVLDSIRNNFGCMGTVKTTTKAIKNGSLEITGSLESQAGMLCKGNDPLDIKLKFTGSALVNDNTRKFTISYTYTPESGQAENKTMEVALSDMAANTVKIANAGLGKYQLTGIQENGGCSGAVSATSTENTVNVGTLPPVEIDSVDFVMHKGETFVLGVKDANATLYSYQWQKNEEAYTTANAPFSVTGTMEDSDFIYRLKATDKASNCAATDSVNIYRLPEPPTIVIDTNNTRNDLKITWDTKESADMLSGFRLMANLWDAYGIEKAYSSKRGFNADVKEFAITTAMLDTLEFFYVEAYRSLSLNGGHTKAYYSQPSDTVGYYKYEVKVNEDNSSDNYMAVYFDFKEMGMPTTKELFARLNKNVTTIFHYLYNTQGSKSSTLLPSGSVLANYTIKQGEVLVLKAIGPTVLLQYGLLPDKYKMNIYNINTEIENRNWFFLPVHKISLKTVKGIFGEIPTAQTIFRWDFATQGWKSSFMLGQNCKGEFPLKVLQPMQIQLKIGTNSVEWK